MDVNPLVGEALFPTFLHDYYFLEGMGRSKGLGRILGKRGFLVTEVHK
jgi:hypothetical protein